MTSSSGSLTEAEAHSRLARLAVASVPTGLRRGWSTAIASFAVTVFTAWLVVDNGGTGQWLAVRGAGIGLVLIVLALLVGSTQLAGLAGLPMLGGAAIGMADGQTYDWASALIIGLAWYLATELAWGSIEARHVEPGPVDMPGSRFEPRTLRRVGEVATVMAVTAVVGLIAVTVAEIAPARTLLVKSASVAVVVAGLVTIGRKLASVGSQPTR